MPNNSSNRSSSIPSLSQSLIRGGILFCLVSLCVFATVAFGERWMYQNLTRLGAYLAWTILFILLGGAALGSVVVIRWRLPKFYILFGIAFFAYAAGWVGAYFTSPRAAGEWAGSLIGSLLMALVFAVGFGELKLILKLWVVLFVANSIGYFVGSALNDLFTGRIGMLTWGAVYGLGLGAGIGAVLHLVQKKLLDGD
jgi:hypothetical protein